MESSNVEIKPEDRHKYIFGLRKNVFYLGIVSFFNDVSANMVQSVMTVFLGSSLGVPAIGIGLIEGSADALSSLLKIFSGWFSDLIGKRKALAIFGYAISVATRPFFIFAGGMYEIFSLRLIDRIGKGVREAPRDALLVESAHHMQLGKSFGFHRAMDALGGAVGPLIATALLAYFFIGNYKIVFIVAFFMGLLAILSFLLVKEKFPPRKPDAKQESFKNLWKINRHFARVLIVMFIFSLGAFPIELVLYRFLELATPVGFIPLLFFLYHTTFVIASVLFGRMVDRIGERLVLAIGFFIATISYVIFAIFPVFSILVCGVLLLGVYIGAVDGTSRSYAARLVGDDLLATGEGMMNAAQGIAILFAGIFGGAIWTFVGAQYAFAYAAMFSLFGLFGLFWVGKKIAV